MAILVHPRAEGPRASTGPGHCIRSGPRSRTSSVTSPEPEQLLWIIEPLGAAGLEREQIEVLVVRLGFETIVGIGTLATVTDIARDQPAEIQVAWRDVIGRMVGHGPGVAAD